MHIGCFCRDGTCAWYSHLFVCAYALMLRRIALESSRHSEKEEEVNRKLAFGNSSLSTMLYRIEIISGRSLVKDSWCHLQAHTQ